MGNHVLDAERRKNTGKKNDKRTLKSACHGEEATTGLQPLSSSVPTGEVGRRQKAVGSQDKPGFDCLLLSAFCLLSLQPLAAVDDLGLAREEDFAVVAPEDFEQAAGHADADVPVGAPADHRGDRRRARARP